MKIKDLLFILLMAFCMGCEDGPPFATRTYSIKVINNSENWIYVSRPSYDKSSNQIAVWNLYPDTTLPLNEPILPKIQPNSENFIVDWSVKYEEVFHSIPSGILSIFIFDKDSVDILGWEHIREEYKILHRYDYTFEEFEQMNWTITYP